MRIHIPLPIKCETPETQCVVNWPHHFSLPLPKCDCHSTVAPPSRFILSCWNRVVVAGTFRFTRKNTGRCHWLSNFLIREDTHYMSVSFERCTQRKFFPRLSLHWIVLLYKFNKIQTNMFFFLCNACLLLLLNNQQICQRAKNKQAGWQLLHTMMKRHFSIWQDVWNFKTVTQARAHMHACSHRHDANFCWRIGF